MPFDFETVHGFVQKLESSGETVDDLERWLKQNRSEVDRRLEKHGAILIRGFGVSSAEEFERIGLAANPNLYDRYPGGAPRKKWAEHVWTASETPPHMPIPSHCEMSYLPKIRPKQISFCCIEDDHEDGETPVARMDHVWASLPPRLQGEVKLEVVRFQPVDKRRCMDVRRVKAPCVSWPEVLGTFDKDKVAADAVGDGVSVSWWSSGPPPAVQALSGRLPQVLSSVLERLCGASPIPLSEMTVQDKAKETAGARLSSRLTLNNGKRYAGVDVFFSEWGWLVESYFITRRTMKLRDMFVLVSIAVLTILFGTMRFIGLLGPASLDFRYVREDGTSTTLPLKDIYAIDKAYWDNFIFHKWQKGDIVILNNDLASHGRMPYNGKRILLTAFG